MLNKEKRSEINKLHHCVCMCVRKSVGFNAAATERTFVALLMDVFDGEENPKRQQRAHNVCIVRMGVLYLHQAEMNIWR